MRLETWLLELGLARLKPSPIVSRVGGCLIDEWVELDAGFGLIVVRSCALLIDSPQLGRLRLVFRTEAGEHAELGFKHLAHRERFWASEWRRGWERTVSGELPYWNGWSNRGTCLRLNLFECVPDTADVCWAIDVHAFGLAILSVEGWEGTGHEPNTDL